MKNLLLLFCFTLLLISCNKDSITYEESTFVSDPEEIKWPFVYGQIVSNSGEKMSDVEVDIYQNDSLIGKVFSDSEGKYSTHSIKTNQGAPITIKYQKKDFTNKYRRFEFETSHYSYKNIVIGKETVDPAITKETYDIANPSDTNLVKLYGYAKLKDGTPVSGVFCHGLWEYIKTPDNILILKWCNDYSDKDGYFEVLVPKRKTIHFEAFKVRYPNQILSQCFEQFNRNEPKGDLSQWGLIELGQFTNDYKVELRDDVEFLTLKGTVIGSVLSCKGQPIQKANIKLYLVYKSVPILVENKEIHFEANGKFTIDFENCPHDNSILADYSLSVFIEDTISHYSGEKKIGYSELADFGEINLCFDDNEYPGELNLILEAEEKLFPRAFDYVRSGKNKLKLSFLYKNGDEYHSVYIATDQVDLGEVPVLWFKYWKGKKNFHNNIVEIYETTFDAKPEEVTMTITKIENDYIYGNVKGNVNTPKGRKPVTATFRAYNK